ncbi:MAG: glutathione peroxidase [Oligosphaeraceae bacterium]|nr:glutathione peroxidase [Oligosphaeraceae bacterium]
MVQTADGSTESLSKYRGKVLLIVNTASNCGFTPQYQGLQELYQKYLERGLVVLGFPCNQFKAQEPGSNTEIQEFCRLNYGVSFPVYAKIEVNGDNAHPLYKYLKAQKTGVLGQAIKWNFSKFLVGADGKVIDRYAPTTKPASLEADIEAALAAATP